LATSVRMDHETEKLLDRLAREAGSSKSEVIRSAVRLAAKQPKRSPRSGRPYDLLRGIVGSVKGGPSDLSERTGEGLRRVLASRRHRQA
jgi:hypothetical protein